VKELGDSISPVILAETWIFLDRAETAITLDINSERSRRLSLLDYTVPNMRLIRPESQSTSGTLN